MTELLDSLDEQEAGDMLHYRTLFDEDEDFSQVIMSCHGSQALSPFVSMPHSAALNKGLFTLRTLMFACTSCLSSQGEALSCRHTFIEQGLAGENPEVFCANPCAACSPSQSCSRTLRAVDVFKQVGRCCICW